MNRHTARADYDFYMISILPVDLSGGFVNRVIPVSDDAIATRLVTDEGVYRVPLKRDSLA